MPAIPHIRSSGRFRRARLLAADLWHSLAKAPHREQRGFGHAVQLLPRNGPASAGATGFQELANLTAVAFVLVSAPLPLPATGPNLKRTPVLAHRTAAGRHDL